MPPEAFMMTGGAAPFRQAGPCPVLQGPHVANREPGSFLLADAGTKDGSAAVRLALWRCQACSSLLVGIGRTDAAVGTDPGEGVHVQEFTWLEGAVALLRAGTS